MGSWWSSRRPRRRPCSVQCGHAAGHRTRQSRLSFYLVGLRVGLSVGEVTKEEGDDFGDPVIEAARLCAGPARAGKLWLAHVVPAMAGRRNRHAFLAP